MLFQTEGWCLHGTLIKLLGHHSPQGAGQGIYDAGWVMGKDKPTYNYIYYLLLCVNKKIMSANAKEMEMSKLPTMIAAGMV